MLFISNQYETKCEKSTKISLKAINTSAKKEQYTVVCGKKFFWHQIKEGNVGYTCQTYKWKYTRPMFKIITKKFIQLWMSHLENKLNS